MERICKNCRLFNDQDNVCAVTVLYKGHKLELTVSPNDYCHWEMADKAINKQLESVIKSAPDKYFQSKLEEEKSVPIEVKQVRIWSDGKDGHIESS